MVTTTKLKKYLLSRIDKTDIVQVEKVERYVNMKQMLDRLMKKVEEDGDTVVTENGSQSFTKAHPLIGDINKLNAQMLNIEKSFVYLVETKEDVVDLL